jgi:hypothetical protein
MKIVLGVINEKLETEEDIFKQTIGNNNLHEGYNDNEA